MGTQTVYSRTSYNVPIGADCDTRIFSAKLEYALGVLGEAKINNGIQDTFYIDMVTNDPNLYIGIILTDRYAIASCYDYENDGLVDELPVNAFSGMDEEDIQAVSARASWQFREYIKAFNEQSTNIESIRKIGFPLMVERIRPHLEELSKKINTELCNRRIVFNEYPPVSSQYKNR